MKKIISLLLAVIMVASLFPVMAVATGITTWSALQDAITAAPNNTETTIQLTQNLKAPNDASCINIPATKNIILDLNGYVLDRGLISPEGVSTNNNGSAIEVNGNLTVIDSNPDAEHKFKVLESGLWVLDETNGTKTVKGGVITGGCGKVSNFYFYGGGVYVNNGSFVMNGGNIAGNKANYGGGVHANGTFFTMNGGNIAGNKAEYSGGGVYVNNSGTFTMNNGNIAGNTATNDGGGVYNHNGTFIMNDGNISENTAASGGGVCNWYGTFTMNNGNISENTATNEGGGVLTNDAFTMKNGTISGNTANTRGGGVYANGTVTLGGTAQITGNVKGGTIEDGVLTGGTANNVFLVDNKYITLDTETKPAGNFKVGVTTQTAPTEGAPVKFTNNGASTDTGYFTSDNDAYKVNFNTDHLELKIVPEEVPEPEEPEPERRSYTTVTIGDRDDKEETEAEETVEENPNTGAPVMDLGAVAVVLGAVYVVFKKH